MKFSNYTRAVITSALKRSNQRLAQISKNLPNEIDPATGKVIYSATQRSQIAPFVNSEYEKYLNESRSGNPTFDIRKILKAIERGDMDQSEANDFLVKAAGVRFSPDGEVVPTSEGGIKTTKDILKEAREKFGDLPKEELLKKYEDMTEIREDFQFDYNALTEEVDISVLQNDPIMSKLFRPESEDGTLRRGTLEYDELKEIHEEIKKNLGKSSSKALNYGGNK